MDTPAALRHRTRPVAPRHAFDAGRLEAWLHANLDAYRGPLTIAQFEGGQSNPTFLLAAASGDYVLRKQPPGVLAPSAHAIDREYRVIGVLAAGGFPVPRTRLYCSDAAIVGTPFYLMDYQAGRIFTEPLLPDLQPAERADAYDAMNAALARLHSFDWRGAGLADYGRPERFIDRQLARWNKQYDICRAETEDVPALEQLRDWLNAHIPDDERTSLVHGDFRIGNLIYAAGAARLVAVLDWELSTIGHPFSDIAFNCMTYHLPVGHPVSAGFVGVDLAALGIPSEAEYLEAYARRSGLDPRPHWRFYMAFSLYRTAVIQQGVYVRALKGSASSGSADLFGESFRLVAQAGLQLTE